MAPMSSYMAPTSPPHQQVVAQPAARNETPEPPKPKAPIPTEHQIIQDVFDGLRGRCLAAANHPVSQH